MTNQSSFKTSPIATATIEDINKAYRRISAQIIETPLLESHFINEKMGARILFKPEMLQYTGSFKFRGALNTILSLSSEQRANGVVAFSSGNHAQGVAYAAQLTKTKATIIMPSDAPQIKINNTRVYGAEVILYDRWNEDREEIGVKITEETNAYLIKPYDAILTIAGQGTTGIEIAKQCQAKNITPDFLLSPCGGGGLIAGVTLAINNTFPKLKIYSAEPENFDDTARSLNDGKILANKNEHVSICDALLSPQPGNLTFPINKSLLSGGLVSTEDTTKTAMKMLFENLKLVTEPGGAVGLGALLNQQLDIKNKTVIIILSGGNVDPSLFSSIIQ